MAARAENIKSYLKEDGAFNRYLGGLWADTTSVVKTDINAEDSKGKAAHRSCRTMVWRER